MILSCPACRARYVVDPHAIGARGRRVRCTRCRHIWFEPAPPHSVETLAPARVEIEVRPLPRGSNLPVITAPPRRRHRLGWTVLVLFLLLAAGAVYFGQSRIQAAWPATGRLYAALGLAEPPVGAPRFDVRVDPLERRDENGTSVVVVRGEIVNRSARAVDVPPLRASLRGPDGAELDAWTFAAEAARLEPGAGTPFTTRLERPLAGATGIAVEMVR